MPSCGVYCRRVLPRAAAAPAAATAAVAAATAAAAQRVAACPLDPRPARSLPQGLGKALVEGMTRTLLRREITNITLFADANGEDGRAAVGSPPALRGRAGGGHTHWYVWT